MRLLKLAAIFSLWFTFFTLVVLVHLGATVFRVPKRWKIVSRLNRSFTSLLRKILNIRVGVIGDQGALRGGGYVIISNHVSYVDGIVLGSIFPIVFVAKNEIRSWPVIGHWNRLCGTVFVDRQRKGKVSVLVQQMMQRLEHGANILLFPEGTTTTGERMLPFQTVPLAAPLRARSTIIPVTLAYRTVEEQPLTVANRDLIYWHGDRSFVDHFWRLLSLRRIEATITITPRIDCLRYKDNSAGRKKLAKDCYDRVVEGTIPTPPVHGGPEALRQENSQRLFYS